MAFVKFLKSKSFSSSPIWNAVSVMTIGKVREFIFCVKGNSLCTFIKTAKRMSVIICGQLVGFLLISSVGERLKEYVICEIIHVSFSLQQVSQSDTT